MSSPSGHSSCKPVIIVHGGAGWIVSQEDMRVCHEGMQEAARLGFKALLEGSAVDAVEKAVCYLEDNPNFNAGCGSKLNAEGELEMDAFVMEGQSLKSGAVSCVSNVRNPVKIARLIMEKSEHDFLIGRGLDAFIDDMGIQRVDPNEMVTDQRKKDLEKMRKSGFSSEVSSAKEETEHGTVGAVALDAYGNMACATSTGGLTGKMAGRVGDTPLIGCGGHCDSAVGGVSTTGIGEAIMRVALAARVLIYMEQGLSGQAAASKALNYMKHRTSYESGLIVLSASGEASPVFTSPAMAWSMVKDGRLSYGLKQGEVLDGRPL